MSMAPGPSHSVVNYDKWRDVGTSSDEDDLPALPLIRCIVMIMLLWWTLHCAASCCCSIGLAAKMLAEHCAAEVCCAPQG